MFFGKDKSKKWMKPNWVVYHTNDKSLKIGEIMRDEVGEEYMFLPIDDKVGFNINSLEQLIKKLKKCNELKDEYYE